MTADYAQSSLLTLPQEPLTVAKMPDGQYATFTQPQLSPLLACGCQRHLTWCKVAEALLLDVQRAAGNVERVGEAFRKLDKHYREGKR